MVVINYTACVTYPSEVEWKSDAKRYRFRLFKEDSEESTISTLPIGFHSVVKGMRAKGLRRAQIPGKYGKFNLNLV